MRRMQVVIAILLVIVIGGRSGTDYDYEQDHDCDLLLLMRNADIQNLVGHLPWTWAFARPLRAKAYARDK